MSLVRCSEALKRKSTDSSSPSSTVRRTRISPAVSSDRSLCLSEDYRNKRTHLFTVMPQNPHYKPLDKWCGFVREGIKVGLDVVFINLADRFDKVGTSPSADFSSEVQDFIAQLTELDEMGYDCKMMWDRFDALRALSEKQEKGRVSLNDAVSKRRDKEVKATLTLSRISELKGELKKLEDASKTQLEELESLMLTEKMCIEEDERISQEFRSAAKESW